MKALMSLTIISIFIFSSSLNGQFRPHKPDVKNTISKITREINSQATNRQFLFHPDTMLIYLNPTEEISEPTEYLAKVIYTYSEGKVLTAEYISTDTSENDIVFYFYENDKLITQINDEYEVYYTYRDDDLIKVIFVEDDDLIYGDSIQIEDFVGNQAITYYYFPESESEWVKLRSFNNLDLSPKGQFTYTEYEEEEPVLINHYEEIEFAHSNENNFLQKLEASDGIDSISMTEQFFHESPYGNPLHRPLRYTMYNEDVNTGEIVLSQKSFVEDFDNIEFSVYNYTGQDSSLYAHGSIQVDELNRIMQYNYIDDLGDFLFNYEYDEDLGLVKLETYHSNDFFYIDSYEYEVDDQNRMILYKNIYQFEDEGFSSLKFDFRYKEASSVKSPKELNLSVYPNPTVDAIFLETQIFKTNPKFQIIDLNGRVLMSGDITMKDVDERIDISSLPYGTYQILVRDDIRNYTGRFVKIK